MTELLNIRSIRSDWVFMTIGLIAVAFLSVPVCRATGYFGRITFDGFAITLLLWFFNRRWQAAGGTCKLCLYAVFLTFPFVFAIEHTFLVYYGDQLSEQQDKAYAAYIKKVNPKIIPELDIVAKFCENNPILMIYSYKICIKSASGSGYVLRVVHPAAYFSPIDWNFDLRQEADGADIFAVSKSNEITSDLRRK